MGEAEEEEGQEEEKEEEGQEEEAEEGPAGRLVEHVQDGDPPEEAHQVSARSPLPGGIYDVPALSLMPFSIRGRETSSPTRSDLAEPCGVVIADVEAASGGWPAVQHFAPRGGPGFLVRS